METRSYSPPEKPSQERLSYETKFHTGSLSISVLKEYVLPYVKETVHLGQIGVGAEDYDTHLFCPYGPFRIAAYMESINRSYQGTFIDIDHTVLQELHRSHIYISKKQLDNDQTITAWNSYLDQTNGYVIRVTSPESGLRFLGEKPEWYEQETLKDGVVKTQIPKSFAQGLANQTIQLIESDIVTPQVVLPKNSLHYVDIYNVLYQLKTPTDRWNALKNTASLLRLGGILALNDIGPVRHQLLRRHGGTFPDHALKDQLGLVIREDVDLNSGSNWTVLQKLS